MWEVLALPWNRGAMVRGAKLSAGQEVTDGRAVMDCN
jgi:hypothetical protein